MPARKSISKKRANNLEKPALSQVLPQTATLTAGEVHRYLELLEAPLEGISRLVCKSSPSPWSAENAAGSIFEISHSRLSEFNERICSRFQEVHGDEPSNLKEKELAISISNEDSDEFEKALSPVCSFANLLRHQDSENEVTTYWGWVACLFEAMANETLALMRDRLAAAEGGAR